MYIQAAFVFGTGLIKSRSVLGILLLFGLWAFLYMNKKDPSFFFRTGLIKSVGFMGVIVFLRLQGLLQDLGCWSARPLFFSGLQGLGLRV